MKAAKSARALGINERTLKLWISHPALSPFFSERARLEGSQRELSDDDLLVANTIRTLRAGVANNAANWSGIAERLKSGHRDRNLPPEAAMVDTGLTVMAQHERMIEVTKDHQQALARVSELEAERHALRDQLNTALARNAEDRERLALKLGRAEAELELWRAGRLKPEQRGRNESK